MNQRRRTIVAQSCVLFLILVLIFARRNWRPSSSAHGTATWASERLLQSMGMLGRAGLILGRTTSGKLIRLSDYCHVLLCGSTGSGKGVSIIIPNLLSYFSGSVVCFDTKGDLHETTAKHRAKRGDRIVRLAPFNQGTHAWNPLDTIPFGSPLLVDAARAMAEALVARTGMEHDMHWNDKAVQVITAILVCVLLRFEDEQRNLNSVQEIASDPKMVVATAKRLHELGGLPARLGNQLLGLFEQDGTYTKEGAGVLSTVARHLSFLDSELVAAAVAHSAFEPAELMTPETRTTLFLQIPPSQLDAQRGLLRCWISTLVRLIGASGDEAGGEVLFLLDEASALGSLPAIEEALVRGRSAGVRILLAYQSDSQIKAAFKDKPTLLYDNCTTQIYLGASSIETAERISKSLGEWTQLVDSYGENNSHSWSAGNGDSSESQQRSEGSSLNYSVCARALLKPEEILTLDDSYLIAFQRGLAPILARRVKYLPGPTVQPLLAAATAEPVVVGTAGGGRRAARVGAVRPLRCCSPAPLKERR